MKDKLVKALVLSGNVRVYAAKTTQLVNDAQRYHRSYPTVSAALGRTLSVAAIMAMALKDERERLVIDIRSQGELNHILVQANASGQVKGLVSKTDIQRVNPETGKLDVGGIIGPGLLTVERYYDNKQIFSSQVPLQTGEIGDDFVYYFAQSEQIPSALSVGVLVNEDGSIASSGAIWFEVLPSASEEDILIIEDSIRNLKPVSELMRDYEPQALIEAIFDEAQILETKELEYYCGCNREQMEKVLRALPNEEIQELIDKDGGATLICHYCNKEYHFNVEDLEGIIHAS